MHFTGDLEVIRIGREFTAYQAIQFSAFGLFFVFFRVLQGSGDMTAPMCISLASSALLTIPLGHYLASDWGAGMGPTGVFLASATSAGVVTVLCNLWLTTGRWTHRRC